jgi:hypothetical protein
MSTPVINKPVINKLVNHSEPVGSAHSMLARPC